MNEYTAPCDSAENNQNKKKRTPPREERDQSTGEEVANAVTHGLGAILAIACLAVGVTSAAIQHDVWSVVSMSIFGATMFSLYLSSTLYHAATSPRAKAILNVFDHSTIYLLIAGSYTPFCLVGIRPEYPGWAWSIFGVVWAIALAGIFFQCFFINRHPIISTASYLAMGWIVLIALYPMVKAMGVVQVLWIAAGGIIYSVGVVFYAMKNVPYMHAIWHLFVLGGTLIHYGVMLFYLVLGYGKQVPSLI